MPTDHHHLDPDEDALVKMGYELEDVQFKALGKSVIWFFAFVAFCGVAGVAVFVYFIGPSNWSNPPETTTPFVSRIPGYPNPLLQTNETARSDIKDLRTKENEFLHGKPSWVDRTKGTARIPIDQAIDMFLSKTAPNAPKETTIESGAPPVGVPKEEGQ